MILLLRFTRIQRFDRKFHHPSPQVGGEDLVIITLLNLNI